MSKEPIEPIRTVSYNATLTTQGDGRVRIVIVHRGCDIVDTMVNGLQRIMDLADERVKKGLSMSLDSEAKISESVVCVMNPDRH